MTEMMASDLGTTRIGPTTFRWGERTYVMGILNVTPDSFSGDGLITDTGDPVGSAVAQARRMVDEGADILDIGGESTRPGAQAVSAEDELGRVEPVIEGLVGTAPVSIDTSKASVAAAALDRGAEIVNDVTALRADPDLAGLCAERGCTVVLMHMLGSPRTMQDDPRYEDVVDEVRRFLAGRVEAAVSAGVAEERIWVDPGIGFGKTVEHNLELLRRLGEIATLGRPVVIGSSRKRFLGEITGREMGERLGGTIASNVLALAAGADVFRVHDVAEAREALDAAEAILGRRDWREPPRPVHAR